MRAVLAALALALAPGATPAQEPPAPAALAPEPPQSTPPAPATHALALAAGWEAARLADVGFSGPVGSLALLIHGRDLGGEARLLGRLYLQGRRGETPEHLAGSDLRLGFLFGAGKGRFSGAAGPELASVRVERVRRGAMTALCLGLRLAATADLLRLEGGTLYAELAGSLTFDTSQQAAALLVGYRFGGP